MDLWSFSLFLCYGVDRDTLVYCAWLYHLPYTFSWKYFLKLSLVSKLLSLLHIL